MGIQAVYTTIQISNIGQALQNELEFRESCHIINRFGMVSSKASMTMEMNVNNGES